MLIAFRLVDFLDGQRMMPLGTIPQISQASTSDIDDMGSAAGGDKKTKINTRNQESRKLDPRNFSNLKTLWKLEDKVIDEESSSCLVLFFIAS